MVAGGPDVRSLHALALDGCLHNGGHAQEGCLGRIGNARRDMPKTDVRPLASELWDPELETLVMKVGHLLGQTMMTQAIDRAFLRERLANAGADSLESVRVAVKAELWAAIRPH